MYYGVYNLLLLFIFLGVAPFFISYALVTGKHREGLRQRLGFLPVTETSDPGQLRIWLHAASVGEIQAIKALLPEIRKLLPEAALIVSTMTQAGQEAARQQLGPDIRYIYAPLDLPWVVRRALNSIRPSIYICLETELWPNMLRETHRSGAVLVLLNGRISERSFRRYWTIRKFIRRILAHFSMISAIQEEDQLRFARLGADPTRMVVLGNAKYDLAKLFLHHGDKGYGKILELGPEQPVLVAGSTHGGEEILLLETFGLLKKELADLVLVLAPRHLARLPEIEAVLRQARLPFQRLTECRQSGRRTEVVLVDQMGELIDLYAAATFVFCGGSLVARGGHNLMEPAVWGKPIFYGPHMQDFEDARQLLEQAGAGFPVRGAEELAAAILKLAHAPEQYGLAARQAKKVALQQLGSARKQVQLVRDITVHQRQQSSPAEGFCSAGHSCNLH